MIIGNDEVKQLALKMNNDCVVQAWYRFLKVIGNPVDLCQPALQQPSPFLPLTKPVGSYNHFWNNAWSNFYNAMKGISELIHILLGTRLNKLLCNVFYLKITAAILTKTFSIYMFII